MTDRDYMQMALELAKNGCGRVNPNPMVGAVIVKDGRIIGHGWHQKYGELHAERNALADCKEAPGGAVMYVTLEPCCHWGKTPPCTDAIIENDIKRVVIGSLDPNPLVAGRGAEILRQKGIEVVTGVMREECDRLNEVFFHYIKNKTPYVVMKYAMTMDGKIAAYTGASKWITGPEARRRVQEDRHRYMAIMAGLGTVLADDPLLTCRLPGGRSPVRVICDSNLKTPLDASVVKTAGQYRTIFASCCRDESRIRLYENAGCEVLTLPDKGGHADLPALMAELGRQGIDSVLLEGGGTLNWSALESGIVNKVQAYIAPKLFGGSGAPSPVLGRGVAAPDMAYMLGAPSMTRLGEDILLESEVTGCLRG